MMWSILLLSFVVAVIALTFGMALIFLKDMECGDYLGERIAELLGGALIIAGYGRPLGPIFIILPLLVGYLTNSYQAAIATLVIAFGLFLYIGYWLFLCGVEME